MAFITLGAIQGMHAASIVRWQGRWLIPLYHPSPQVIITVCSLAEQKRDFKVLRRALKRMAEQDSSPQPRP